MSRFSPVSRSTLPAEDWRDVGAEIDRAPEWDGTRKFELEHLDVRDGGDVLCRDGACLRGEDGRRDAETADGDTRLKPGSTASADSVAGKELLIMSAGKLDSVSGEAIKGDAVIWVP